MPPQVGSSITGILTVTITFITSILVVITSTSIICPQARMHGFSSSNSHSGRGLGTRRLAARVTTSSAGAVFVLQVPNAYEIRWGVKASAHFIGRKTKAQMASPQARPYHQPIEESSIRIERKFCGQSVWRSSSNPVLRGMSPLLFSAALGRGGVSLGGAAAGRLVRSEGLIDSQTILPTRQHRM